VKVPRDYLRLEVRKAGYQTIELAVPMFSLRIPPIREHLKMDPLGSLPENMVRIPKSTTDMQIVGIEKYGPREVPEFLIDKFEITNKQFKAFRRCRWVRERGVLDRSDPGRRPSGFR